MSAVPESRLSIADYLAIEKRASFKSEYFQGEMFAMAGASRHHNVVNENLSGEIHSRLKGGPCQSMSRDQRVKVDATGLFCYPDLVVVCGKPEYATEDPDTLVNPKVIFEVLSDSTERYDRTTKFRHYQQIASVMEYVLVSQNEPMCERYFRQDDGSWAVVAFVGMDATFELKSLPIRIPLADLYSGVEFPEPRQ